MMVVSHLVFSVGCTAAAAAAGLIPVNPLLFAVGAFGSLLPDIDHPSSWLGRRLPFISYPISAVFGHRGITHSLLAIVGMAYLLSGKILIPDVLTALIVGYLSHLFGDSFTHKGIPLFWPNKTPIKMPWTFKSGSATEKIFIAVLVLLAWQYAQHKLPNLSISLSNLIESTP